MSHRRDIIGLQMAEKFIHLREHAPSHSLQETKKNFKTLHGREISEIFQEFDEKPIASGSVGQVYKAKYKGKKVAVKVRHPGIDKYIEKDINLLFFISRFLGTFSKSFNIPITQHSMKRTMTEQVDFTIEKQNLLIFNSLFSSRHDINFPIPFQQDTNEAVLVETFAEGVPITYFQENTHTLNSVIARLGADTFFEMLLKHNFIHADGHGGNIIVEITQKSRTFFSEIWDYLKEKIIVWEQALIKSNLETELMRNLYQQGRQQSAKVRKVLRQASDKVMITVIDVGMVITLDETDRKNFINFIYSVLQGDGNKCAHMIFSLSKYNGKHIQMEEHKQYMTALVNLFTMIKPNDLDNLPGVELFGGMLNLIRDYNMKLQGQFATLLTNMLVLEGMAKNIDPDINILKTAIPYFKYIKTEKQIEDFQ